MAGYRLCWASLYRNIIGAAGIKLWQECIANGLFLDDIGIAKTKVNNGWPINTVKHLINGINTICIGFFRIGLHIWLINLNNVGASCFQVANFGIDRLGIGADQGFGVMINSSCASLAIVKAPGMVILIGLLVCARR